MPDELPAKCCGRCRWWDRTQFWDRKTCHAPYIVPVKLMSGWPSSVRIDKWATHAHEGSTCPKFQPVETNDAE